MVPISKQFCMGILAFKSCGVVINWTVDGGGKSREERIKVLFQGFARG